jgi:shikimate kinase
VNIVIIGITGVGKTTVGRMLADKLSRKFIDLDESIEENCGVDIQRIFSIEGEEGFRKRETKELERILHTYSQCVLSVGGGCAMRDENRKMMIDTKAYVAQLTANVDILVSRLITNINKRPLFNDRLNIKNKVIQLRQARDSIYNIISNFKIDTSGMRASDVAELLSKEFNKFISKS